MVRDRSSSYERIQDAMSDIVERVAELEAQLVERIDPRPSLAARVRRSIDQETSRFFRSPTARYLPNVLEGVASPTIANTKASLKRAQRSLKAGVEDARAYLPAWNSWQLPSFRSVDVKGLSRRDDLQRGIDYFRARPGLATLAVVGGTVAVVGAALYVTKKVSEHAEEPDYETVRQDGDVEIRDYDAMVIAETIKSGYHEKARRNGYRTLHDFIRANNRSGKKIAMTIPVLQQLSEGEGRTRGWAVRFVMPKKYTKASLPAPNDNDVSIIEVSAKRVAVITFNGSFNASLASKKLMTLYNYLSDQNLKQVGDPIYAFYNAPWTPGFMRRNEIILEIER